MGATEEQVEQQLNFDNSRFRGNYATLGHSEEEKVIYEARQLLERNVVPSVKTTFRDDLKCTVSEIIQVAIQCEKTYTNIAKKISELIGLIISSIPYWLCVVGADN